MAGTGRALRELQLIGFEKFSDRVFASIFPKLPSLQVLVLRCFSQYAVSHEKTNVETRGCSKVGPTTVESVAVSCRQLNTVNLGYTAATPLSVAALILACPDLEVLKLAALQNWVIISTLTQIHHAHMIYILDGRDLCEAPSRAPAEFVPASKTAQAQTSSNSSVRFIRFCNVDHVPQPGVTGHILHSGQSTPEEYRL